MVSPSQAAQEPHWWKDDRYAIYDVNVNSSVVYPQHGEEVEIDTTPSYTVKGYAYGGGGRRINRVEVSLDDGASKLTLLSYPIVLNPSRLEALQHRVSRRSISRSRHEPLWRPNRYVVA